MRKPLTPEVKRDIEAAFVFRQELAARRRALMKRISTVGISAGVLAGLLGGLEVRSLFVVFLNVTWMLSMVAYVGGSVVPLSLGKDMDLRWHLNPWQGALRDLDPDRCMKEAIALLAGPLLIKMVASLVYWLFR